MKRLAMIILAFVLCSGGPVLATPSIEFSPGGSSSGGWNYDGAGTLSFDQFIAVDSGMASNADALVGASVFIPTLKVGEGPIGVFEVKPLGSSVLTVRSEDFSTIYLKATLNRGDLVPIGTVGGLYTTFKSDLTDVVVTDEGKALGSAVLAAIANSGLTTLDFELSLQGGSGTNYRSINEMLAGGFTGGNGFSGSMTIPEPTTIAMLAFGTLAMWRKRKG
ncbi:MAG: PEP-CTERM sorting domain-containing protein [Phycisphaerales bacterium]|nr:MAG: PEP-CTERM sorting domain-containing protein [Phycisphaerales bacterium]